MVSNEEYTSAFTRIVNAIDDLVPIEPKQQAQEKPETEDLSAELGHYLEAITLSSLALGAYAMSVSCGRPEKDRPPLSKYINYVKVDDREIDALIKVGYFNKSHGEVSLSVLFEVSRSFNKDHVSKCNYALKRSNIKVSYCIYATLDVDKVDFRDDKVIVAPLPLALLLF